MHSETGSLPVLQPDVQTPLDLALCSLDRRLSGRGSSKLQEEGAA